MEVNRDEDNDDDQPIGEYHYERNNSLPELFGDEAHVQAWEKYWAKNGERLIWQSWIEKYIDYINPDFLDQSKMPKYENNEKPESFEAPHASSTEIVISSPVKQSTEDLMIQGWNQISPDSIQHECNLRRRYLSQKSNEVNENLLQSPRCDSINSSIPYTIGATTDSMTNVTRMTISSYGFESSHVTSESTPTSSSQSEIDQEEEDDDSISSFSESESDNQMATTRAAFECEKLLMENKPEEHLPPSNDKDSEEYWQKRWQSHAQEQYVKHYNKFMEAHRILQEEMSNSFKSDSGFLPGEMNAGSSGNHKRRKKSGRKKGSHSLQRLVANLNLRNDLVKQAQNKPTEEEAPIDGNDSHHTEQSQQSDSTVIDTAETSLMESMGLPTAFVSNKHQIHKRGGGGGDEPQDERPINLKRSHESEGEEIVDHIKSQFEMMGYAFVDKNSNNTDTSTTITKGEIVYRKKHVRLHNRMLKMFPSTSTTLRPRHTFFDDDGKEIMMDEKDQVLHSSSDEDAPVIQPPSTRINNSLVPFTTQLSSDGNANEDNEVNINLSIDQEYDYVEEEGKALVVGNDEERGQTAKREKKKKRKGKFQTIIPVEIANDKVLKKYWYKRFSLFSMFDQGIQLDRGK